MRDGFGSLLEDPIWSSVNLDDVGTGGEHRDDAVGFLRHLGGRVHHLNVAAIADSTINTKPTASPGI